MRRAFLISLTVFALLLVLGSCGPRNTADVVIIGGGGAGLAAAVEAADAGASVIVVEKMPLVGGNTNYATGGMNAAGTEFQAALGIEDSEELYYEDTMAGGRQGNNPALVRVLAAQAGRSVAWLTDLGADLSDVGRLGGHSVNRTHRPTGGAAVGSHIVQTLRTAVEERDIDLRLWTEAIAILSED
ncbi:MAG: FAD-dependent oxidoreductase, partial [Spirochaetales bacterium]|nr:FAD-dependent oxidoreductase [Spirochaetales bacterium]